jgi:hypothetical protein
MIRRAGVHRLSVCLTGAYPPDGVDAIIAPRGVGQPRHTGQRSRHSGEGPLPTVLPSSVGRDMGPIGLTPGGAEVGDRVSDSPPNRRWPGPPADVAWRLLCSVEVILDKEPTNETPPSPPSPRLPHDR